MNDTGIKHLTESDVREIAENVAERLLHDFAKWLYARRDHPRTILNDAEAFLNEKRGWFE